jgi:hypothetical protein
MEREDKMTDNEGFLDKALRQSREDAQRAHDQQDALIEYLNKGAMDSATAACRSSILINGGAAAAVLAFVGGLVSQGRIRTDTHFTDVTRSLVWFAFGVAVAATAMGFAYLTNASAASAASSHQRTLDRPYVVATKTTERWDWARLVSQILTVALALGSIVLFVSGMLSVRAAITQLIFVP